MKKNMKSKRMETKHSSTSAAAGQDIVGLLTTLVQKLTSFETKIDTVLSRIPPQPIVAPRQQTTVASSFERRREPRPMYKVICANCGRDSEVPFKPSRDRPVYCKECFKARKHNGAFKPPGDDRPKEGPSVQARPPEKPEVVKPARPVKKKKPAAKKKKKNKRKK